MYMYMYKNGVHVHMFCMSSTCSWHVQAEVRQGVEHAHTLGRRLARTIEDVDHVTTITRPMVWLVGAKTYEHGRRALMRPRLWRHSWPPAHQVAMSTQSEMVEVKDIVLSLPLLVILIAAALHEHSDAHACNTDRMQDSEFDEAANGRHARHNRFSGATHENRNHNKRDCQLKQWCCCSCSWINARVRWATAVYLCTCFICFFACVFVMFVVVSRVNLKLMEINNLYWFVHVRFYYFPHSCMRTCCNDC